MKLLCAYETESNTLPKFSQDIVELNFLYHEIVLKGIKGKIGYFVSYFNEFYH